MDDTHNGAYAREPQIADLVRVCRALNEAGARYLLIGGVAVIRTKNTVRPSDAADRRYLEQVLLAEGGQP